MIHHVEYEPNRFADIKSAQEFLELGYTLIEAPYISAQAEKLQKQINSFFKTVNEEKKKKMQFYLKQNDSSYGPIHKTRKIGKDEKFLFDYVSSYRSLLHLAGVDVMEYEYLLEQFDQLHNDIYARIVKFLFVMEGDFFKKTHVDGLVGLIESGTSLHTSRGIYYPPTIDVSESPFRADEHIDICCITAHIYQDRQGLYLNTPENIYEQKEGHILLFSGAKMAKLTGGKVWREKVVRHGVKGDMVKSEGGIIPAIRHGVIAPSEFTALTERNVFVSFFHTRTSLF